MWENSLSLSLSLLALVIILSITLASCDGGGGSQTTISSGDTTVNPPVNPPADTLNLTEDQKIIMSNIDSIAQILNTAKTVKTEAVKATTGAIPIYDEIGYIDNGIKNDYKYTLNENETKKLTDAVFYDLEVYDIYEKRYDHYTATVKKSDKDNAFILKLSCQPNSRELIKNPDNTITVNNISSSGVYKYHSTIKQDTKPNAMIETDTDGIVSPYTDIYFVKK